MNAESELAPLSSNPQTSLWVTDLQKIAQLSQEQQQSHQKFAELLKTKNSHEVDLLVQKVSQNVAEGIDCKKCANCCRSLTVAVNYPDMISISENLNLQIDEFKTQFMKKDPGKGMVFKKHPCPLLKNNLCSVYESRPSTCRTYPHLENEKFISRLGNILSNLKVCPIAYNTFELLKLNYE